METLDIESIDFNNKDILKSLILKLLDTIEQLAQSNRQLHEETQRLKDEINRLKGEKGKPNIPSNTPPRETNNHQKKPQNWTKRSKKPRIKIDRTEHIPVDKDTLPPDAEFKGYRSVIKQNIKFETDNVEYILERYYSPSENRVYEAELPEDVQDSEFGSELKSFIVYLYYAGRVTENKIQKILEEAGIIISEGEISNILTKDKKDEFTAEKQAIFESGMNQARYFHIDDTGARHDGTNYHAHVVCDEKFTVFFILPNKNRDTIRGILGLDDGEQTDKIMVSDDAGQFSEISSLHALCWIHEIRHYLKLNPFLNHHYILLNKFLRKIWNFYKLLTKYKEDPNENRKAYVKRRFNSLFSTKTGYGELDHRIALTKEKEAKLLLVLDYLETPLHNNTAEIAVREEVIKRKISYGTRSEDGRTAWENMLSILDTCRKQGVSFFEYLRDIFSNRYSLPSLSELVGGGESCEVGITN
ncbi:MAG: transposase [Methanosarcinales archaeon]|nr:transposase [Methanosarcinales archaeon]